MHGKKKKGKKVGYGSTSAKPKKTRGTTRSTGRTATSSRRRSTAASKKKKTGY